MYDKEFRRKLVEEVNTKSLSDPGALNKIIIDVSKREKLDFKTLKSWWSLVRQLPSALDKGSSPVPRASHGGLDPLHLQYAIELFKEAPSLMYKEIADGIWLAFKTAYSEDEIENAFHKIGWSDKVLLEIASQCTLELTAEWKRVILDQPFRFPASQFVFVDESHFDLDEIRRPRGKSPKGVQPVEKRRLPPEGHEPTKCSIYAMSIEGTIAVDVVDINNAASFLHFLEHKLLPAMHTRRLKYAVFDNASVHLKCEISVLCVRFDCSPLFLPPYSAWLNPTEPVHFLAKGYIRRKWGGYSHGETLSAQILEAYWHCLTPDIACNEFRHSGFKVQSWERLFANRNIIFPR